MQSLRVSAPVGLDDNAEDNRRVSTVDLEPHAAGLLALSEWVARVAPGIPAPPLPIVTAGGEVDAFVAAVLGATAQDLAAVRRALDTLVACVVAAHADSVTKPIAPENPTSGNALRAVRERRLHQQQQRQQQHDLAPPSGDAGADHQQPQRI
eukprot:CAMPEP_0174866710 /NCGR_PEP_ID=MMETSP1114-20130205/62565_1 /TAXON_ID=312471 /ORGANISM="Neobodo designis, Strain CCAP 1951/1" /LENGTH=151 /DNA_ID=CAMNT_0016101871 /DNA_START=158 /DNA_END=610 /DNA_ORIENTATION=+